MSLLHLTHLTIMSFNSVTINGGAGFSCDGVIGVATKQQGHFTLLQSKILNQITMQLVQTSALQRSSRAVCRRYTAIASRSLSYLCVQLADSQCSSEFLCRRGNQLDGSNDFAWL